MFDRGSKVGKYEVRQELGRGGMGAVYVGWDEALQREIALKVMNPKSDGVENAMARFQQEARSIGQLSSEHITHVYEYGTHEDMPYIAMEYVRGETLLDIIADEAPMDASYVLDCARQALRGLSVAHKAGIIHRDIKPANILRSNEGVIKLTDFGLARSLEVESGLTASGLVVGTVHYMAPEVARGDPATFQSDLYSLGVSLYEMLTGDLPFNDDSPLKLISKIAYDKAPAIEKARSDLPPSVAGWLNKLLASEPAERYTTADQVLADLARVSGDSIPVGDDLYESDLCITAQMAPATEATSISPMTETQATPTPNAPASPVKEETPVSSVNQDDADKILQQAMKLEKEENAKISREGLLKIADEVGVSPEAVDQALKNHQANAKKEKEHKDRLQILALAAAALLVISIGLWVFFQAPAKAKTDYDTSGGQTGSVTPLEDPDSRTEPVSVGESWQTLFDYDHSKHMLVLKSYDSDRIEIRVGDGPIQSAGTIFCGSPRGQGDLQVRAVEGSARVAGVCLDRLRMAVMPFDGGKAGTELGDLAFGIGDAVGTRMAQKNVFQMIERAQVDKVIGNIKLEQSEFFDPATASRVGKMLGVDYLVNGSVQKVGSTYRLAARWLEAETGNVRATATTQGSDIFAIQDELADLLLQKIGEAQADRFFAQ